MKLIIKLMKSSNYIQLYNNGDIIQIQGTIQLYQKYELI